MLHRHTLPRLSTRRRVVALGSVAVVAALFTGGAAPGANDSGFGNAGWVHPWAEESVAAILPQRDGKIVVVDGQANLLRVLPDGRRDRSFGKDGKAAGPTVPCDRYQRTRVAVQPDGKLVISQCSVLTRRLTDGSLDRSFGVGGRVVVKSAGVSGLAVAPDGTIVAGLVPFDRPLGLMLARYLPNGRPDTSFGSGGRRAVAPRAPIKVAVQPDGKIVVTGFDVPLARYLADGRPDDGFGANGVVDIEGLNGYALALQPDGKIVVVGIVVGGSPAHAGETVVMRVLPDGRLDPEFGVEGIVGHSYAPTYGIPTSVAVLPDGGAAITGYTNLGSAYRNAGWLSAVVTPDGQWKELRAGVEPCGDLATDWSEADSIARQEDGKLLVGGFGSCEGALVGRFTPALELDAGPPLTLAVEPTDRGFAHGSVRRGVAHLTGAVVTSDDARVTVSVERVNPVRPCIDRATVTLRAGTRLGTTRRARPGPYVTSRVRGRAQMQFDAALSLDRLKRGESYTLRIYVADDRSRSDAASVRFTLANAALRVDPGLVRCLT